MFSQSRILTTYFSGIRFCFLLIGVIWICSRILCVLSGFCSYYAFLSPMVLFRTETVLLYLFPFLSTFNLENNKPTTSVFLIEHLWCLNIYTIRNIFWTWFDPKVGAIDLNSGTLPSKCRFAHLGQPWAYTYLKWELLVYFQRCWS